MSTFSIVVAINDSVHLEVAQIASRYFRCSFSTLVQSFKNDNTPFLLLTADNFGATLEVPGE